ncbi:TetR/AcrR family transcriptional regulator [Stappia sp.]|uniref:TetR/AcrR family transcriptional regulator n=1 Tax=Stappia sp. TaxID=1870903 RepID=UPI003D133E78
MTQTPPLRPATRDAIIEAAFRTWSADPAASLEEIAALAGVGRATLHRHFAGRDDLLEQLGLLARAEMEERANAACIGATSHTDALRRIMAAMIALGDRHWFLARAFPPAAAGAGAAREERRTEARFLSVIAEATAEGTFDPDCPPTWIATSFDHLIHAAWGEVREGRLTHSQAAELAWSTLTRGLEPASR